MDKLPTELLQKILSELDPIDLWQCSKVSRIWSSIVYGNILTNKIKSRTREIKFKKFMEDLEQEWLKVC